MAQPVIGVAGSVRMMTLTAEGISKAEKHGKRLDASSQSRKINDLEPISTTGLNLKELHEKHMAQADKVRKGDIKAFHLLIQFPQYLVADKSPEWKLEKARAFAERVFGDMAVFADRLDVDEKNQDVVDVFVAPLYLKKTLRTETIAFGTTKHLPALAVKHKKAKTPQGMGQALQDELFKFFKGIGLENAKRGAKKERYGKDWKSSEELRAAELDKIEAQQFVQKNMLLARNHRLDGQEEDIKKQAERLKIAEESLKSRVDKVAERQREMDDREADLNRRDMEYDGRLARLEAANEQIERGYVDLENERAEAKAELEGLATKKAAAEKELKAVNLQRQTAEQQIANHKAAVEAELADKAQKLRQKEKRLEDQGVSLGQRETAVAASERALETRKLALDERESAVLAREANLENREKEMDAFQAGMDAIYKGEILGAIQDSAGRKGFKFGKIDQARKMQIFDAVRPAFEWVWSAAKMTELAIQKAADLFRAEAKAARDVVARLAEYTRTAEQREALNNAGLQPFFEQAQEIAAQASDGYSVADHLQFLKGKGYGR